MRISSFISIVLLLAACGDEIDLPEPQAEPDPTSWSHGVITFANAESTQLNAQFYNATGIHRAAVFAAFETWTPDTRLDLDTCSSFVPTTHDDFIVELLDLGPIELESPSMVEKGFSSVETRRLPDYFDQIHGVVYQHDFDFDSSESPPVFSLNDEQAAFSFSPQSIAEPNAQFRTTDSGLAVTWTPDVESNVYLDIETSTGRTTHCRLEDDGVFDIPLAWVDAFGSELVVRRASVQKIAVDGFDSIDVVSFTASRHTLK